MNKKMVLTIALPVLLASSAMNAAQPGACPNANKGFLASALSGKNMAAAKENLKGGIATTATLAVIKYSGAEAAVQSVVRKVFTLPGLSLIPRTLHKLAGVIGGQDEVTACGNK